MEPMQTNGPDQQKPRPRRLAVSEVAAAIGRVRSRIRYGAMVTAFSTVLVWAAILFVTAGLLDLAIGLGPSVRRAVFFALLGLLGVGAIWILVRIAKVSQRQAAARLDAALLEQGASGSEARGTLEFSEKTGASDLLSRTIARRIAETAADRLHGFRSATVRTGFQTGRAMALCVAILLIAGAGQILAGDLMSSVGRRLFDPDGGHPRWSPIGVSIESVRIDPSPTEAKAGVWAGDTVRIVSEIERMPEQVRAILMVQREGSAPEPIPLDAVRLGEDEDQPFIASMTISELTEPARVWVELQGGPGTPQRWRAASREITIDPEQRPRLRAARLTITPPEYTGLPEQRIAWPGRSATTARPVELAQGALMLLETQAAIDPSALRGPVERPRVRLRPNSASIEWTQVDPEAGETVLTLHGPVRLDLAVIPDQAPVAEITWPEREEVVALAGAVVPIRVLAEDDYAVDQATLDAAVVGDGSRSLSADLGGGAERIEVPSAIDTQAIGAVAGDVIEVRLHATDNRPAELGGNQTMTSRVLRIRVVDPQQFAQMLSNEIGPEAAEAFEEQQESENESEESESEAESESQPSGGSSQEPCPHCESGECEGECQGGGEGSGQGSGQGFGSGSGQGAGSSSGGASGSSGGGGESSAGAGGSEQGSTQQSQPATEDPEGQPGSSESDSQQEGEERPWRGRETEPAGEQSEPSAGEGDESSPSTSESPTGPGGRNDDGFRTRPEDEPVPQPIAPPLAEDPDGLSGPTQQERSDLPTEAETSVPERYRDLVRAYYERRSRTGEGNTP